MPSHTQRQCSTGMTWAIAVKKVSDYNFGGAIQSARGYARPAASSEWLLELGSDWLTERATLRGIVACDGEWLLLDYEMRNNDKFEPLAPEDRTRGRAWFRGLCESSETTCDMRSVDK